MWMREVDHVEKEEEQKKKEEKESEQKMEEQSGWCTVQMHKEKELVEQAQVQLNDMGFAETET